MVPAVGYGRLDFILALTLPPDPRFEIEWLTLHILAHITEAKGADGNAATEFVSFTEFGRSVILDVSAIESLVGQVETRGVKATGEWYVIDRSDGLCRAVFHPEEHEFEDDEN